MTPNALVPITLFGWIPLVITLFALLPPRRAVLASYILGWLFLPVVNVDLPGLPPYNKITATSYGIIIAIFLFDAKRLFSFRLHPLDLPMVAWCLCPIASSVMNGLGLYDGLSAALDQTLTWGMPYFIGRLYLRRPEDLRELAIALVIGGLLYMPLCLWEIRMSPRLHYIVYGFKQHSFAQTIRFGGWRPMVFMQHGLALAMFMTTSALAAVWLWRSRSVRRIMNIPIGVIALALLGTAILCKSMLAIALLALGLFVLASGRLLAMRAVIVVILLIPPAYMYARSVGGWSGQSLLDAAAAVSEDRALSLQTRLDSEDILVEHALEQPTFGWGGWSRNLVKDKHGRNEAIPDAEWVITLGKFGVVGLVSFTMAMLLPACVIIRYWRPRFWRQPALAPAMLAAVILALYMCDNLFNAMRNPLFVMAGGGLVAMHISGVLITARRTRTVRRWRTVHG